MALGSLFGRPMQQKLEALCVWEEVLSGREFRRIVELGTGRGNWSLFLALWCYERGADFQTFDISQRVEPGPIHKRIGFRTGNVDVFAEPSRVTQQLEQPGRTVLFCDDGDKPREMRTFVPHCKPGDIVAVHDWGTEIGPSDLEPIRELLAPLPTEARDGKTAFFTRTEAGA